MKRKKRFLIKPYLIILIILAAIITFGVITTSLAASNIEDPNYFIFINSTGSCRPEISHSGDLFGNELWYPGKTKSGVIRIQNNTPKTVRVTSLGIDVVLNSIKPGQDYNIVETSFLDNINLTIQSKKLYIFDDTIIKNIRFQDLLYKDNDENYPGFSLDSSDSFKIGSYDQLDLRYTLEMDRKSGDELENLSAKVDLIIDFGESQIVE